MFIIFSLLFWSAGIVQIGGLQAFVFFVLIFPFVIPSRRKQVSVSKEYDQFKINSYIFRAQFLDITIISVFLIISAFISSLNSGEIIRSLRVILPHSLGISLILYISRIYYRRGIDSVISSVFIFILIGSLINIFLLFGSNLSPFISRITYGASYRYHGLFEAPIQIALCCAALVPVSLSFILTPSPKMFNVLLISIAVIGMAISPIAAGGKFAMGMFLLFSFIFYIVWSIKKNKIMFVFRILFITIFFAIASYFIYLSLEDYNPILFSKLNSILFSNDISEYQSIESRSIVWDESIRLFLSSPLVGVGAGTYVLDLSHSHNFVLDYARGMGVLGAFGSVAFMLIVLWHGAVFLSYWLIRGGGKYSTIALGAYFSSIMYIILNQMSDSFGVGTSPVFWIVYIMARVIDFDVRNGYRYSGHN